MRHVQMIAARPHPVGSPDHARVQDYIMTQLAALGTKPEFQRATAVSTRFQVAGRVENVLARIPGTSPGGPAVLLAAHYDGVGAAPAAGDDASGSAVLLEVGRALRAGPPLLHDVILLFTDGEESGLLGAAAFVREHPWAHNVQVILNFEARGTGGRPSMFQTGPGNLDQVRLLRGLGVDATSLAVTVYRFLPNDTDLSEFFALDTPALNFAFADGVERYHTSEDDYAHLDPGTVQEEGRAALELARTFGAEPLPRPKTADAIFFDLPLLGLVWYPEGWARPIAILAVGLVLVAIVRVRRREQRWLRDLLLGIVGTLVAVGLGGLAAFGAVFRAAPEIGDPGWRGLYALAIAALALAIALACWALIRRWASAAGAHLGALVVWTPLAIFLAWKAPGTSFVTTWPLIGAAGAAILSAGGPNLRAARVVGWIATILASAIIVPLLYGMSVVALGVVGVGGVAIGGLTPLLAWLLASDLEALAGPRPWGTALFTAVLALVVGTIGFVAGPRYADYPSRSALAYAQDADGSGAWLGTSAAYAQPGSWAANVLGSGARAVMPGGGAAADGPPVWLTRMLEGEFSVVAVRAPRVALIAPTTKVIVDSQAQDGRHLTVLIRPAPGTLSIGLRAMQGTVLSASVDGRVIDPSHFRYHTPTWQLSFAGPLESGFTLGLTVPKGDSLTIELTGRSAGLPSLPSRLIPPRPEHVLPSQTGDISIVYRKVRF